MKPFSIVFSLFVKLALLNAQTIAPLWARQDIVNGSTLYGVPLVIVDSFHNTIVCSNDYHPGPLNSFLTTKYDPNGTLLWQRKFDLLGNDFIISSATDSEGSVYVGGNTSLTSINGTLPRFIVIKYASNGDSLWNYRFDGPTVGVNYITKVLLDSDENLMVFGQYGDTVALRGGLFVAKVSPNGQELWRATYLDPIFGFGGLDVRWIGDRWVFWGSNFTTTSGYRFLDWQVSNDGSTFSTSISEPDLDNLSEGKHIDHEGNLFVGVWKNYWVKKYSTSGQKLWEYKKTTPPPQPFVTNSRLGFIESKNTGEVFLTGVIRVDSIGLIPLTTKLTSTGEMVWEHTFVLSGIPSASPSNITWISQDLFVVAGVVNINLDSNFFEISLSLYNENGFLKGGITDLEGQSNFPTSLIMDDMFLYVGGVAQSLKIYVPNNQILCKYALSDLVSTHTAPPPIGQLSIWPNPSAEWVRIQIPEGTTTKGQQNLELIDVTGKILRSQYIAAQHQFFDLSLEGLPSGTYFVIFKQNGLPTHTEQVIKP